VTPRSRSLSARCSEAALVHPWKFLLFQPIVLLLSTCIRHHSRHPLPQLQQLSHILPSRESMEYRGRRSRFPRGDDRRRRLSLTFARGHQPELGQDGQTQGGAEPIPKTDCSPASTLACSSSSVWPDSRRPMAGTSPIIFGAPFGCGIVVVFLAVLTYLVDSYTVYVASVLAANSVVRSLFGAAFPL